MLNERTCTKRPLVRRNTLDGLLSEIQFGLNRRRNSLCDSDTGNSSAGELCSSLTSCSSLPDVVQRTNYTKQTLQVKDKEELLKTKSFLDIRISRLNHVLLLQLKIRDRILRRRDFKYDIITASLQAMSPKRRVDTKMRFSVDPLPGDSGFSQWCAAMQMVSRLPGGIPIEFRKRLWLTLADKHVQSKRIDWKKTRYICLNEKLNPDDDKLGVQIVKDLHRTGCSMFSGEETEHNQALLKKVLLAYARWNKVVGYCQGFNMLAAIILEVMEWNEENALKVMIYLIEEVLPEGYFANHMRGLSVDMAVFRELLKMRFPVLSQHLDRLQYEAQDSGAGTSYEPPLTNVFTMQWFLTLFSNCLPKSTVLRVWDLIFLEGNEVLLRTALSIWGGLADRVLTVESADEFYSIMGVLTREMLEFGIMDANDLVKTICSMTPLSPSELNDMRDKYAYNIRPLTSPFSSFKKNLKLLYSDDEDECDDDNLAMATWCLSNTMQMPKNKGGGGGGGGAMGFGDISPGAVGHGFGYAGNHPTPSANNIDAERMSLDISALKKQYAKLRERQKQAHVILTGAFANNTFSRQRLPVAVNHLLVGKKPLVRKNKPTSKIHFEFKTGTTTTTTTTPGSKLNVPGESSHHDTTGVKKPTVQITRETGKTLSWAEVKKERDKVKGLKGQMKRQGSNNNEDYEEDEQVPESPETETEVHVSVVKTRDLSESSSCSSSSTELCDNVDLEEDDYEEDFGDDLSPDIKKYSMSYLEEPLTAIKASSSYEADEDSVTESVDSSTLIPSESTSRNIASPGSNRSNSTLGGGEDQLLSGSNSVKLEDTLDLSSYLETYRRSLDNTSPKSSTQSSPDSGDINKFDAKTYLANYKLSKDLEDNDSSDSSSDGKLSPGTLLSKLRNEATTQILTLKTPEDEIDEDDQLDTTSFLEKIGIKREISPNAKKTTTLTTTTTTTSCVPEESPDDKYGLSSYLAKYKLPLSLSLESSPDQDTVPINKTDMDHNEKTGSNPDLSLSSTEKPVEDEQQTQFDASKYLSSFTYQQEDTKLKISAEEIMVGKEEPEVNDAKFLNIYCNESESRNKQEKESQYGLSKYLMDYSTRPTQEKSQKYNQTPSPKSPLENVVETKTPFEKKQSPKTPNSGESSSPYDSSSDPPLSSPEAETIPELSLNRTELGLSTTKTTTTEASPNPNETQGISNPTSSNSTLLKKQESQHDVSSSNGTSITFNPFPTVKKIGYIANATAKLGLYTTTTNPEKDFGNLKDNNSTRTPVRTNSFKQKFQFPKTLK